MLCIHKIVWRKRCENHGRATKLVHHLKDPDFFEVDKFPFSTIAITRVASLHDDIKEVTRNLTIKGITPGYFSSKNGSEGRNC